LERAIESDIFGAKNIAMQRAIVVGSQKPAILPLRPYL
jgi:hypothetical protein